MNIFYNTNITHCEYTHVLIILITNILTFKNFTFLHPYRGAMVAICDVNEYRKCVRRLGDSLVSQLFDILHSLCNLLLVKQENLQEVCGGETLNYLDKSIVLNFIQLRSDYKSIKQITANLKTY